MQPLKISEILHTPAALVSPGKPSIFIRTQGCSAQNACFKSGIICDTEFESGKEYDPEQILKNISKKIPCKEIVWSGGEPTDQLTEDVIDLFKKAGYYQCIETSGIRQPHEGIDYIALSPKVAEHTILKRWKPRADGTLCDELRWVRHVDQELPKTKIKAHHYFLSPHFDGEQINYQNLGWCMNQCLQNPKWRISVQQHKLWRIR